MTDLAQRMESLSPAKRRLLEQRLKGSREVADPIAIVGMACRFPGAPDLEAFWQVIHNRIDATGEIPSTRWDVDGLYDPTGETPGKMSVRWAGMVDDVEQFDPVFFGISPREAARMDPQQRLLLEVTWEALENSGLAPDTMAGSKTGVFVGIGGTDYSKLPAQYDGYFEYIDAHVGTGNALSIAANRLSYLFDLHGPSLAVDTACSSGVVALHLAAQSLRNKECTAAIAGGVNLILTPETTIAFSKARMLSPDGHCRPFDASANGYVRGEGCGMLVLKRLTDATRDGDEVLAVIRATAVNQDGRTSGITAPSSRAQEAVIRTALGSAGLTPERVNYVEAHGTATPLGDPIEFESLRRLFRRKSADEGPCYVGSVKGNIGHTETVSGIAGIIKVVLMLRYNEIPPQPFFEALNPHISLEDTRIRIPTDPIPWQRGSAPRLAGVSSFGFGGTNTHVVLEEAAPVKESAAKDKPAKDKPATAAGEAAPRPLHLLTLSAKTADGLDETAIRYADYLEAHPDLDVADVCFSANTGRSRFHHRAAVVADNLTELRDRLRDVPKTRPGPHVYRGEARRATAPKAAFLFTGQGAQYVGMGKQLYGSQPAFRKVIDQCEEILRDHLEQPLREVLFAADPARSPLNDTAYTQPGLFALEYALASLWRSWGVEPSFLIGHSVGEYVAACVSGALELEDGLRLIAARAAFMQRLPRDGKMAVVFSGPEEVRTALADYDDLSIAAENGPENTVVSGNAGEVDDLLMRFAERDVRSQELTVSHAFHSPLMDPMLDAFQEVAERITYHPPRIPIISNLTGEVLADGEMDGRYWRRHVRQTVRFATGMRTLAELEPAVMLEVGPSTSLLGMGRRCLPGYDAIWLPSLRKGQPDWSILLGTLANLTVHGAAMDLRAFDRDSRRQRVGLPNYPFHRERCWLDPDPSRRRTFTAAPTSGAHPLLGSRAQTALETDLFEASLASTRPALLADHQVQDTPVVPAAAYLEQALAAAREMFGDGLHAVENVTIQQALMLPQGATRRVELTARSAGGRANFQLHSLPQDEEAPDAQWTLHATGTLVDAEVATDVEIPPIDIGAIRQRTAGDRKSREEFYDIMAVRGLNYGPAFKVFEEVARSDREACAKLEIPDVVRDGADSFLVHPSLGDACMQIVGAVVPREQDGSYSPYTYLPTGIGRVRRLGPVDKAAYVCAERTSDADQPSPESVVGTVRMTDDAGRVLLELTGVTLHRVGRGGGRRGAAAADWMYQVAWQAADDKSDSESDSSDGSVSLATRRWIVFADQGGLGAALAHRLGAATVLVEPGEAFEQTNRDGHTLVRIDPLDQQHLDRLLKLVADAGTSAEPGAGTSAETGGKLGVVHLWSCDLSAEDGLSDARLADAALAAARRTGYGSVVPLVQRLVRSGLSSPALWLVTRGGQDVRGGQDARGEVVAPHQAALWGLGRVLAMEHPELTPRLVDLDPRATSGQAVDALVEELARQDQQQVAWRDGIRLAGRLQPAPQVLAAAADADRPNLSLTPSTAPYRLCLTTAGSLDSLRFEPMERQPPEAGHVEIEIHATGLNFSDVLKAMGLYPGLKEGHVPMGIECSGIVTAVGKGVDRFQVGQAVMGVAPSSFASHATTAEYALVAKPDKLSHDEAATIPITFLTAYHALVRLAQLAPGERLLIHAGAGGVGLAAIQIAQQVGAELFATAGSDRKRDYLRELGVPHVMNSRTLEFADEILRTTDGQGVDVVLNSLPGEAIPKSLAVLRAYGRFLEIGKTDIYQNRMLGLAPFQDNLSYFAIDLDRMLRQRPEYIQQLFAEVIELFEQGQYRPLPLTLFEVDETVGAFRYMTQRKNIGKVVVKQAPDLPCPAEIDNTDEIEGAEGTETAAGARGTIRSDASYLITGGTGALGLQVADWLVEQGARHLGLLSRRPPTDPIRQAIDRIREKQPDDEVRIEVIQGDVSDAQSLRGAIEQLTRTLPPLRGVIHAAGVLDDGLLIELTPERFDKVLAPKVRGGWNLHEATRDLKLDFFVMFSSVASLLGSPGQSNYATANAFLDGLSAYRRARGLPSLSINWGPWSGAGMAASEGLDDQLRARGMEPLPPREALDALGSLLRQPSAQVAVMHADWPVMARVMSGRAPTLLQDVMHEAATGDEAEADEVDHEFRTELEQLADDKRIERLADYFAHELARIMGLDVSDMDPRKPLEELGMDSLLAMELRMNLERSLAISLPMAAFLDRPTVTSLAEHAARELTLSGETRPAGSDTGAPLSKADTRQRTLAAWSPLAPLKPSGSQPPLFFFHPLGGDIRCYVEFARRSLADQPVYALLGRGCDGALPPHESLGQMADVYIEALRGVQPRGPYYLAGWSAGGIVALEVAQRLQSQQREVGMLVWIDTPMPSIYEHVDLDDDARFLCDLVDFVNRFAGAAMDVSYEELKTLEGVAQFERVLREAQRQQVVPEDVSSAYVRHLVDVAKTHVGFIKHYEPATIEAPVHLFRPSEGRVLADMSGQDLRDDLGWGQLLGDRLRVHRSPGDHFSMMLGDSAAALAKAVAELIDS